MESFILQMTGCSGLSKQVPTGALGLLDILRECSASLLVSSYGPTDKKPSRAIDRNGNIIIGVGVEHELLAKGRFHNSPSKTPAHDYGTGTVRYIQDTQELVLNQ